MVAARHGDGGVIYVAGQNQISGQMLEQARRDEAAWNELEWIALHYDEATDEQRARLDTTLAAIDEMDDWTWD